VKLFRILIIVTVVTVSLRPLIANGTQTKSPLTREMIRLIQKLDADSNRERLAAKRQLLKLGPKILPMLPRNFDRYSVNSRQMLRDIRTTLIRRKTKTSLQASRVTLKKHASLRHLLNAIAKQTKNELDFASLSEKILGKEIAVDFHRQEFWRAMDDLAEMGGFDFTSGKTGTRLNLIPRSASHLKVSEIVSYSGAVRFAVRKIRVLRYVGDRTKVLLRLEIVSRIEPRLRPLFFQYKGSEQQIKINNKEIESFQRGSNFELPYGEGGISMSFHLDFVVRRDTLPQTLDFQGKFQLTVAAGEATFRFEKSQIPQTQKQVDVTVQAQSAEFTKTSGKEGKLAVRIGAIYSSPGPEFESYRTWIFHNRAYLETKNRHKIFHNGKINTLLQDDGAVLVEYNFEHVPTNQKDLRFVYLAPTLIVDVPMKVDIARLKIEKPKER